MLEAVQPAKHGHWDGGGSALVGLDAAAARMRHTRPPVPHHSWSQTMPVVPRRDLVCGTGGGRRPDRLCVCPSHLCRRLAYLLQPTSGSGGVLRGGITLRLRGRQAPRYPRCLCLSYYWSYPFACERYERHRDNDSKLYTTFDVHCTGTSRLAKQGAWGDVGVELGRHRTHRKECCCFLPPPHHSLGTRTPFPTPDVVRKCVARSRDTRTVAHLPPVRLRAATAATTPTAAR